MFRLAAQEKPGCSVIYRLSVCDPIRIEQAGGAQLSYNTLLGQGTASNTQTATPSMNKWESLMACLAKPATIPHEKLCRRGNIPLKGLHKREGVPARDLGVCTTAPATLTVNL